MIDSHAGAANDQAALSRKVLSSNKPGVARRNETSVAKTAISTVMMVSIASRNRRGSKMSASAPAGSVNRNIGRLAAT